MTSNPEYIIISSDEEEYEVSHFKLPEIKKQEPVEVKSTNIKHTPVSGVKIGTSKEKDDAKSNSSNEKLTPVSSLKISDTSKEQIEVKPSSTNRKHTRVSSVKVDTSKDHQESDNTIVNISTPPTTNPDNSTARTSDTDVMISIENENSDALSWKDHFNQFLYKCRSAIGEDAKGTAIILGLHKQSENIDETYLNSLAFIKLLKETEKKIEENPDEVYIYIMNVSKGFQKNPKIVTDEEKIQKKIHKLEKNIEQLHRKIKKLELIDFDITCENDDTPYILEDKFKKLCIKNYRKICALKQISKRTGLHIEKKFSFKEFPYPNLPLLAKKIEDNVNKIKRKYTPDYPDILNLVKEYQNELGIPNYSEGLALEMAEKLFKIIGNTVQHCRKNDLRESMVGFATLETDNPKDLADEDPELNDKLIKSHNEGNKKIDDFIDSFVLKCLNKQNGDENGEKQPEDENDDEQPEDENGDESDSNEDKEDSDKDEANIEGDEICEDQSESESDENNNEDETMANVVNSIFEKDSESINNDPEEKSLVAALISVKRKTNDLEEKPFNKRIKLQK